MSQPLKTAAEGRTRRPTAKTPGIGVVRYCIHGPRKSGSVRAYSTPKLLKALQNGLPVQELADLQATLDVPMEKLVPMLRISKATLHRRKTQGKLDPAESDRV